MRSDVGDQSLELVRILDYDSELAALLHADDRRRLRDLLIAESFTMARGRYDSFREYQPKVSSEMWLMIMEGICGRSIHINDGMFLELLGVGDVFTDFRVYPADDSWNTAPILVLDRIRVAVLSRELLARITHFPLLLHILLKRLDVRARRLSHQLAINSIVGIDRRIMMVFCQLANRWGRVTRAGVVLNIDLTNECLGHIVGGCCQSVSTAKNDLMRRGVIERRSNGGWLVRMDPLDFEVDLDGSVVGEVYQQPVPANIIIGRRGYDLRCNGRPAFQS